MLKSTGCTYTICVLHSTQALSMKRACLLPQGCQQRSLVHSLRFTGRMSAVCLAWSAKNQRSPGERAFWDLTLSDLQGHRAELMGLNLCQMRHMTNEKGCGDPGTWHVHEECDDVCMVTLCSYLAQSPPAKSPPVRRLTDKAPRSE